MQSLKRIFKVMLFLSICFTASCTKSGCYVCKERVVDKVVKTYEVCDEFEADKLNGRRWVTGGGQGPYTVHTITCE